MGSHSPQMTPPPKEKYARVGQVTFRTIFKKPFIWNTIPGFIVILETKKVDSFG